MQVQSSSHSVDTSHEWSAGNIKLGKAPFQNDPRSLLRLVAACSGPADDLHAVLAAAGIPPPDMLVGHSIGGIIARRFCARYPGLVAGIVLVESCHEDQERRISAADWRRGRAFLITVAARRQARILGARRFAASLGLIRGLDADVAREAAYAAACRAIMLSTRHRRASVRELLMMIRMREDPPQLGSVPLTVLTRAPLPLPAEPVWAQLQDELAALSSDSVHVHAERGSHYLQFDEPDLVVQAVRDLVRRCR